MPYIRGFYFADGEDKNVTEVSRLSGGISPSFLFSWYEIDHFLTRKEELRMAIIKPFRGLRPRPDLAEKVAAPPYDVINSDEARQLAEGNPYSFLHVNKPEIDLPPETDPYDPAVYAKGAENLSRLIAEGIYKQDEKPYLYVYRQIMNAHVQLGLVACVSCAEYRENKIKKHELTRVDKEEDRLNHILSLQAQTGPVFLTYRAQQAIDEIVDQVIQNEPVNDFKSSDGIQHTLWIVSDENQIKHLQKKFSALDALYVADGHHRSAAATRAAEVLAKKNPGAGNDAEFNFFLSVIFPDNQLKIMDYNRVVKDLNGLKEQEFIDAIGKKFLVREFARSEGYRPKVKHDFGMYLNGMWYRLSAIPGTWKDSDPTEKLDVSILYNNLLKPVLGIGDLRLDKRIDFVGGMRGIEGLEARVDKQEMMVAFSLYPTSIEDLITIADAGEIMPPKTTWFEPKLRSGLVIHLLDR